MTKCPQCGIPNPSGRLVCRLCSRPLPPREPPAAPLPPATVDQAGDKQVGTTLLTGVPEPIAAEPRVRAPHEGPSLADGQELFEPSVEAALFAQIAEGEPSPSPAAPPRSVRGRGPLSLRLLLAMLVPLLFPNLAFFSPPPALASVRAFATTLDTLPAEGAVLLAFEYEAGMLDEVERGAIATLTRLRTGTGGPARTLLVASTTPQGPPLAERAWARSQGEAAVWQQIGYLPGETVGVRYLLADPTLPDLALLIVLADESRDVQRWLEQASAQLPGTPVVAVAPSFAEAALAPYLASGQLAGLLAGLPGAASYHRHFLQGRAFAWHRLDALSFGALWLMVVMATATVDGWIKRTRPGKSSPL